MAPKPGLLDERRRIVHSWPAAVEIDSLQGHGNDTNLIGAISGSGLLGARHQDGVLQARLEYHLYYWIDTPNNAPRLSVYSEILFEGNAPTNQALAFLLPFLRQGQPPSYLVAAFEANDLGAPATAAQAAERAAVKAIEDYGGFITRDAQGKVLRVNLIYDDAHGERRECTNTSDQVTAVLPALQEVEEVLLQKTQATDFALRQVVRLPNLKRLYLYFAIVTDQGLAELKVLPRLELLFICDAGLNDAALEAISTLRGLTVLQLQGNGFTDDGLAWLAKLKDLKNLWLGNGSGTITDAGLAHLEPLTKLEELEFQNTEVTDAGLHYLDGMTNLARIWLSDTKITKGGLRELKAKHPGLKVNN